MDGGNLFLWISLAAIICTWVKVEDFRVYCKQNSLPHICIKYITHKNQVEDAK